ncbi:hypothetical protein FB567DRAFT_538931 [Paraphoma chrysanthemicola]|uniref:Retrotransposon Copia-like N-terminal domain-containing protein n=1 Tax=Paraphoma chrysanthemicola TaxID=798071 RepID=A0A8K0QUE8_9PLEO|nr:hypothetical protein FB567DRAFT_538931 [Paraphoma chrysanthemicola]
MLLPHQIMSQLTSPRLPGVPILLAHSSGPEYSRWRRHIKFALEAKDSWKYCNGKCRMPMPDTNATSANASTTCLQPCLLEERREWVRHDREVKLDIFLSLAEEVMHEVFEVGPPLPPSSFNAQEMLAALDRRFIVFSFESYHHAFCHFLNLHIDQYTCIKDFNREFLATLEDLLDYGQPLTNMQACSAYFSKLRCTQNPWVTKKLAAWDAQPDEVDCAELLKESPPWSIIRPLATKASQNFQAETITEEHLEDSSVSDSDEPSEHSLSTVSSVSSHSRQVSNTTVQTAQSQESTVQRNISLVTASSQEITIHASSDDIAEINQQAFDKVLNKLPQSAIPERGSSKNQVPGTSLLETADANLSEWLVMKKSVARHPPPPHNRPLPPLPPQAANLSTEQVRSRSVSPEITFPVSTNSSKTSLEPPISTLRLETTHPVLRPITPQPPLNDHPALRAFTSLSTDKVTSPEPLPIITSQRRPSISTPDLAIPWPSTPDLPPQRPHSSRAILPSTQAPNPMPSQVQTSPMTQPPDANARRPSHLDNTQARDADNDEDADVDAEALYRTPSSLSELDLPLQGTRDSAWDYLYESKGGYLVTRERSVSPISSSYVQTRASTFQFPNVAKHGKMSSLDLVSRLSGNTNMVEAEKGKDKYKGHKKKKSWSGVVNVSVNLARFSAGKGVREII